MVHVEDRFISQDGTVDFASAKANPSGIAILSILFHVNPNKAQVCDIQTFTLIFITRSDIIHKLIVI